MTCPRCGSPIARPGIRFCTACGAPLAPAVDAPGGQPAPPPPGGPAGPYGAPQPPYGQPQPPGGFPPPGYPPYGPPPAPRRSSAPIGLIVGGAVAVLLVLAGISYWALSQMDDPPLSIGRAAPTPTPTVAPTNTPRPGLGVNVPGPQGTPTTVTIPIPGINATVGVPKLPIPGRSGSPVLPAITGAGATPTPAPGAKLNADQARQKVKDETSSCRLLQTQLELAQVTFEAPDWVVRLPLTGATWRVNDETGAVTADERAAERVRTCR